MKRFLLSFYLLVSFHSFLFSQYSLTLTTYSQNFDGLGTGNSTVALGNLNLVNSTLNGWYFSESGTNANTTITSGTGSANTGDTYNFGSVAIPGDRTLGGLQSGSLNPTIGFYFTNNTGSTITELAISYKGEQWRLGTTGRTDQLDFQYSQDATSLTSPGTWTDANLLDFTAPVTAGTIGFLDGNLAANQTTISHTIIGLNIPNGSNFFIRWNDFDASGSDDGLGIDDFGFTATLGPAYSITIDNVHTPPFTLPNCATGAGGSVDYTATGTFITGGTFTVQLSDNTGSFASPVVIATAPVDGLDPVGNIIFTIPAGTVSGVAYRIRIVSNSPTVTSSLSSAFEIIQNGINGCMSAATDYFRSRQFGNWGTASTWESSPDNISWISPATLSPTSSANTILIRNSHTVTLAASVTVDQVFILNGGVLVNQMPASNILTVANGTGDDIEIQSGGMYHVLSSQGYSNYQSLNASATIRIKTGGTIRLGDGTLFGGSNNHLLAATSASYVWENNSVFEWNSTGAFGSSGVIFFPDVNAVTIPVFKTLVNPGNIGAGADTRFNGVFEAGANIIFVSTGQKIFRNGIRGAGNIDGQNGTTPSGKFIINGTTAELGGSGSLVLPTTNGLDIGSNLNNTLVTVTSNKTITGNVSLLSTNNTYVELGANNLTVTGTVSNGGQNAYIRTNGIGFLKLNLIGSTKTFPIGNTSYNPVIITNGSNNDFSARVENDINPGIAFPSFGINRTWSILASAATAGVNVTFQYATADANPGATPQPRNMEILMNPDPAGTAPWSIISGNGNIVPGGADPAWTIQTTSAIGINNARVAYALGTSGGYALSVDYFITAASQKRNNTGVISWKVFETANVASFEVQRSVGNSSFVTIGTVNPVNGQLDYHFTDFNLDKGTNLYRVKVNRQSGGSRYSNQVAVINGDKGFVITSIAPNPVQDIATATISAAKQGGVDFKVYDLSGTVVRQWHSNISEGSNTISMNVVGLAAGTYHVLASSPDTRSVFRFIKQ